MRETDSRNYSSVNDTASKSVAFVQITYDDVMYNLGLQKKYNWTVLRDIDNDLFE